MATATRALGTPHRYGTGWLVPSSTTAGVQYYVNADATRCSCRGFSYRGTCRHLRTVREAKDLIEEMLGDA
jgi:SWIM zinc finger